MRRRYGLLLCCFLCLGVPKAYGQFGEAPINTFGYFQTTFEYQDDSFGEDTENSFSVQQLNLLFQTDFSSRWRAFINFEVLNNFSSSRRWGSFDLDEAWISYRGSRYFILKAGLHVPPFNRLNEIKNRTPLLPYIVRPLIYEESFAEVIAVGEFIPDRAFLQVSGSVPAGAWRLAYAAYLGNSPNINSQFDNERTGAAQQTGVDTSQTVLVGGRAGVRYGDWEAGVSATRETVDFFRDLAEPTEDAAALIEGVPPERLEGVPKTRLGVDFSAYPGPFSLEAEFIAVRHGVDPPPELGSLPDGSPPRLDLDRTFYYGTLGYDAGERSFVYASYWNTEQAFDFRAKGQEHVDQVDIEVFTVGARRTLLQDDDGFDRITLKAQYALARIDARNTVTDNKGISLDTQRQQEYTLNIFGVAISVLF